MKNLHSIRNRRPSGFTLMELMLVLGIITLLIVAGMKVGPAIQKKGRITAARADIGTIGAMIIDYQNSHSGRLPQGLQRLVDNGSITDNMLNDPWGNRYQLVIPSKRSKEKFDLYSMGDDGIDNNADDIGNWEADD